MMTSTGSLIDPGTVIDAVGPPLLPGVPGCVLELLGVCPAGELLFIGPPAAASPFIIDS